MNTTSRKEILKLLPDIIKELHKKLDVYLINKEHSWCEYVYTDNQNWVCWKEEATDRKDEVKKATPYATIGTISIDANDYISSDFESAVKVGFSFYGLLKGRDNHGEIHKKIKTIFIATRYKQDYLHMSYRVRWYDHLHPNVIQLKKFLKRAAGIKHLADAVGIEHMLAKMIPNRIDNVILGGVDEQTKDS